MTQFAQPTRPTLSDAPVSLDAKTLDELFPAEPSTTVATAAAPAAVPAPVAAPVVPQVPPPDEPYLQGASSVYRTREAAVEGTNQKDALISQLRQQYSLVTGIDPITKQPLQNQTTVVNDSYATNPDAYVEALRKAKTPQELTQVQQKFMWDTLQPIVPAVSQATRTAVLADVNQSVPEFNKFYGSAEYKAALDQTPSLKEAIETAEGDIRYHSRLPDLYKTAHLVSKGIQLPELLRRATPSTPSTPTTTTLNSTTSTPPEQGSSAALNLTTAEGRKAIIQQFEQSGRDKLNW